MEDALANKRPAEPAPLDTVDEQPPVDISWKPTREQLKVIREEVTISNRVVTKLVAAFKDGLGINAACRYAGIHKPTYYRAVEQSPAFALLMEDAQETLLNGAHRVVKRSIEEGDVVTAREYIRTRDDRFKPQRSVAPVNQYNQFIIGDGRAETPPSEKRKVDVEVEGTS